MVEFQCMKRGDRGMKLVDFIEQSMLQKKEKEIHYSCGNPEGCMA